MTLRSQTPLPVSNSFMVRSQHFLVPPFQRLPFTLLFVLANWVGSVLVFLLLHQLRGLPILAFLQTETIAGTFVFGVVTGTVLGAMQWLVLRRYWPDWLWIVATATGYVLWLTTLQGWRRLLDQLMPTSLLQSSSMYLGLYLLASTVVATACAIWLGLSQWLVLRRSTRSLGWIFVPMAALLVTASLIGAAFLLSARVPLRFNGGLLSVMVFSTVQAVAFSALQKRCPQAVSVNRSLATAPEITDYQQVQTLTKRLRLQLNQSWLNEPADHRPLQYLVGVEESGAIAAYEPLNQAAINHTHQTPLPALVNPSESAELSPLAHFQVTFLPSGRLEIMSWRGLPLIWLGLGMVGSAIVVSVLVGYLSSLID